MKDAPGGLWASIGKTPADYATLTRLFGARGTGNKEKLGYCAGGYARILGRTREILEGRGAAIHLGAPIRSIRALEHEDGPPRCELTVEGHTDSSGGAQQNLRLSESRAQAVMQYMIENMDIAAYRIKAAGFGDSRPIANNGTAAGRALNRRIDLLIMPKLDR